MRAVANAAGTNTPAVYRRFKRREEILLALVQLFQKEIMELFEPCRSIAELAQTYLNFALSHPREYELMMSGLLARMTDERPNIDLVLSRVADWHGGTPEEPEALVFTLYCLLHGCALLNITGMDAVRLSPKVNSAVMWLTRNSCGDLPGMNVRIVCEMPVPTKVLRRTYETLLSPLHFPSPAVKKACRGAISVGNFCPLLFVLLFK